MCPTDKYSEDIQSLRDELIKTREELDQRYQDINQIYEIVRTIHSTLRMAELSKISKSIIENNIGLTTYSLAVYDSITNRFVVVETSGLSKEIERHTLSMAWKYAQKWEETKNSKIKHEIVRIKSEDQETLCFFPLSAYRRVVGALCTTEEKLKLVKLGGEDIITLITSQLTIAMENSILYEITRKLSITDDKTGVYNHRYIKSRLDLEWRRAERYNRDISFLMLDIDDFKKYNDKYGHIKGDRALCDIAHILITMCRQVDIVARFGGEEFCVILPETSIGGAEILASRIVKAIADHNFGTDVKSKRQLTISIGAASFPKQADNPDQLISRSDVALYDAKKVGKNCYKLAETQ